MSLNKLNWNKQNGVWTPVLSSLVNFSPAPTVSKAMYGVAGNMVICGFNLTAVEYTSSGLSSFIFTVPVAPAGGAFVGAAACVGGITMRNTAVAAASGDVISVDGTATLQALIHVLTDAAANSGAVWFMYAVNP